MGLFNRTSSTKKKKASVTVVGKATMQDSMDGRYKKQIEKQREQMKKTAKKAALEPHTTSEVLAYIQEKYEVKEIPSTEDYYQDSYQSVRAELVLEKKPEFVTTAEVKKPIHPPKGDHDPDYEMYRINRAKRMKEASCVSDKRFPMNFSLYVITIRQNGEAIAWIDLYLEENNQYLSFSVHSLDDEEPYQVRQVMNDIICYFGASKSDKKERNNRFMSYCSALQM